MCGRYYRTADKQTLAEYFHAEPDEGSPDFPPAFNIAPTTTQPVIRQSRESSARELTGMRWGLVGFGTAGPDPKRATFNARSENLSKSSLWRTPMHKRRCLVPVSGFFEWRKSDKIPFRFTLANQPAYAFAGLWDAWLSPAGVWMQSFSIITVPASPTIAPIHDRMPAILAPAHYDEWLARDEVERPPLHLLRPWPDSNLLIHAASPRVGNVRNQDIALLDSQ